MESREIFSLVAPYYDFLNHILSLNKDTGWRDRAVSSGAIYKNGKILDLCTGTAETAILIANKYGGAQIIGVDFSHSMLRMAKVKIDKLGLDERIGLVEADALNLPFNNSSFDAVTISFGLRNIPDCRKAMNGISNVLKTGGKVIILEFSPAPKSLPGKFAGFYIYHMLPWLARLFGGAKEAYGHLSESIKVFLTPEEIIKCMESAGLKNIACQNLYCGIVNAYYAEK